MIKARLVNLRQASPQSCARHLRYIERDSVGPNGETGHAYDGASDTADQTAFEEKGREDRHQFRFIVSAEDAVELEDLKTFTRALVAQVERDLDTKLEWVAVDHWDTDDPHTHVVVRGIDEDGRDLIIAREYIAHGLRARACQIATEWLGPRTEVEINASLDRDVDQERWTPLDRQLQSRAVADGCVDLADLPAQERVRLIARLQRLTGMGLAEQSAPGQWVLSHSHEATLRALGERGDIVRTMQRAMKGVARELSVVEETNLSRPIEGRVVARGLVDEMEDRGYVIIDGLDGRAHFVRLPGKLETFELPIHGIVQIRPTIQRDADQNIVARSRGGVYRPSEHRASLGGEPDADEIVTRHVRRLEALRRAGIVERIDADTWRLPDDFLTRARRFDHDREGALTTTVRSPLSLEQQQRALGTTWLDAQLLKREVPTPVGFGAEVRHALDRRAEFLIEQGLARRQGAQLVFARDLLNTLRAKEITRIADQLGLEFHRPLTVPKEGERVGGIYRRSIMLANGRFALLDDGASLSLVPWRPIMERKLGQSMSGIVRHGVVSWTFNRDQSPSR